MDIHEIAKQLIVTGAAEPNSFDIVNNEIVPKDKYTCNYLISQIKALGYDAIEKDGKILLTGETLAEQEFDAVKDKLNEDYIDGNSMIDEAKDTPSTLEIVRTKSEIRKQIEDLYNKAEETVFTLTDYQESGTGETKSYLAGLKSVLTILNQLKNQANGSAKPSTPGVDF